ncbi:hypothetical protein L1281_000108 [Neisseria sp. HSC-16F19]|nr:hypothetical protein [Neisseria sp. HSC-16F19]MCP2039543.1 hypothetical protein [Neisseria sp. HSC-16F19]
MRLPENQPAAAEHVLLLHGLMTAALTPGDGTVAVAETVAEGCRDHLVLSVSHSSMLLDAEVAAQVGHFLRYGCFQRTVA